MPAPKLLDPARRYLRDSVRWPDDPVTRYVVARHPGGLTAPQVAAVLELAPSNVHRDQASALAKLRTLAADPELGPVIAKMFEAWADAPKAANAA
jgi:hypothetical protein